MALIEEPGIMDPPLELEEGTLVGDDIKLPTKTSAAPSVESSHSPSISEPPDGGYGWVVCLCQFVINASTWGMVAPFGVFLSFYIENDFFPGASDVQFAFVGGIIVGAALLSSPVSAYLAKRYGFKVPLTIGLFTFSLAQIFAAFSTTIWELFLTQGLMFGLGVGLLFIPTLPIISHWFTTRRALAIGLASGGSGGGGLVFSITTRIAIENLGLHWAFIINALISFVLLTPAIMFMSDRVKPSPSARFKLPHFRWMIHGGFSWVCLWGVFATFGYLVSVMTVDSFSTAGLGLTQAQGANIQAITAAAQVVGRPGIGILQDRFGRINMTSLFTLIAGLSCLFIWMFSESYGLLIFFSIIQGMSGGIFYSAGGSVTAEVAGLQEMASAITILWVIASIPSFFAEAIAVALAGYTQNQLHWHGAQAFLPSIGFAGGCFLLASILLLGAKQHLQHNWVLFEKV